MRIGPKPKEDLVKLAIKKRVDSNEFELPETCFIRDIENRVFQGIVLQCLAKIDGIVLMEGKFIDNIWGRDSLDGVRGIHIEQDTKRQCVNIRIELNVFYGICIPDKAEEIQTRIAKEITKFTGLHVSGIHVIFKNIVSEVSMRKMSDIKNTSSTEPFLISSDAT